MTPKIYYICQAISCSGLLITVVLMILFLRSLPQAEPVSSTAVTSNGNVTVSIKAEKE